jgi:hypothetical protein
VVRDVEKHNSLTLNVSVCFQVLNNTEEPFRIGNIASCSAEYWYFYEKLKQIKECENFVQIWAKSVVADSRRGKMNLSWDSDYSRVKFGSHSRFLDRT